MGFIKGGLLFFAGLLLLLSLIVGNIFLTINLSLNYDNVKIQLTDIVKRSIQGEFNQRFTEIQTYCQSSSEYVLNIEGFSQMNVPCGVILNGEDSSLDYVIKKVIEDNYYKEYNCGFFNCPTINGLPLVYVSQHAKEYWKQKFYLFLAVSLALIILMFFLTENKKTLSTDVGLLIIISTLPLLALNWIVSNFDFISLTDILFYKAKIVFWIMLIFGAVIMLTGFAFRLFGFFTKDDVSKEEVKEIVKEEVSKAEKKADSKTKKK